MKHVQVQVAAFNSSQHISQCLESILAQDHPGLRIVVLDNGSTDGTPDLVRSHFPDVALVELGANLGFAGAHNRGFASLADAEFALPLNDDAVLAPGCLAALVAAAEASPRTGSMQPKLLRPGTSLIDTTGICLMRSRRAYDRGQGEEDVGQYDQAPGIFAANGAAPLYRRAMLDDVRLGDEVFDEDFFMYKEDLDLGWRGRLMGWDAVFVPAAVGYHARGWAVGRPRSHVPRPTRVHSLKNRYLTMLKNDVFPPPVTHWPALLGYEMVVLGGLLLREPFLLQAYWHALRLAPKALAKRRELWARRRVSAKDMEEWFGR